MKLFLNFDKKWVYFLALYLIFVGVVKKGSIGSISQLFYVSVFILFLGVITAKRKLETTKNSRYFFIWLFFSFIIIPFCPNTDLAIKNCLSNLYLTGILFSVENLLIKNKINSTTLVYCLCLGFFFSCILGVSQFYGKELVTFYSEESLNQNIYDVGTENRLLDLIRVYGSFGNALTFSLYLAVVATIVFSYLFYQRSFLHKIISFFVFAFAIILLLLTISRTSTVIFLFIVLLIVLFNRNSSKFKKILLLAFILFGASVLLFLFRDIVTGFTNRLTEGGSDFKGGRLGIWNVGLRIFLDNPFFGSGPGNLNLLLQRNGISAPINNAFGHTENYFLTIIATYGLIGGLPIVLVFFRNCFDSYKLSNKYNDVFLNSLFWGLLCMALSLITNPALIDNNKIQVLFILIISLIADREKKLPLENKAAIS